MDLEEIKNFFMPDWKKLALLFIFLLLTTTFTLTIFLKLFIVSNLSRFTELSSHAKSFYLCTNSTQTTEKFKECYTNETKKSESLLRELSDETRDYSSDPLIRMIYPRLPEFVDTTQTCIFVVGYSKYLLEFTEVFNLEDGINSIFQINTRDCCYKTFSEIFIMVLYFYLISCLIVCIYHKIRTKRSSRKK